MDEALVHAERTARSLAKRRHKTRDLFFVDEMITEGYFIVTQLILTSYEGIITRFPDVKDRFNFYRMSVGFGLKAYLAYRPISTLRYLKAKGIVTHHVSFEDNYIGREDKSAMIAFLLEEVTRSAMEKKILEFFLIGNSWENIEHKVGISVRRVKKVMRRIKRRLKESNQNLQD